MVGSSSQQRQLITYHVEFTEEEHPQPAPSPEHSLAYRRPTGGGRQVRTSRSRFSLLRGFWQVAGALLHREAT